MRETLRAVLSFCLVCGLVCALEAHQLPAEDPIGVLPVGEDGRALNFDFERGNLDDWNAEGKAFQGQPIEGDTVEPRRSDMRSLHAGDYWIGTFEVHGDEPKGTLTSVPFEVTHPWASFLVAGGRNEGVRVELVRQGADDAFFRASGDNTEELKAAIVDLRKHQGEKIFIRLVDDLSGGWGHINFDDFRFHAERPHFHQREMVPERDVFQYAGLSPEEAARAMTLPEGFQVTLFAGEPDVRQPIAMALDDRGRLWIAEAYDYPIRRKEGESRDRILIFEDTTGDGRYDERKVFIEGLNLVSGLELGFGGVWVGAAPHLLFIPDRDGDDQPDGPPEILLDGWGYQDTHETLNALIWGPDGWLYGCHGVFTRSYVGKPGTPREDRIPLNAAIWRYHPTRHQFEVFAHGTSNPWGVDFNDVGDAFCTACVIPHLFHIIQGARYHRQSGQHFNRHTYDDIKTIADHVHWIGRTPHAGNQHSDAAGGGHAHSGAMIYLGGAWPEEYRGHIFMNNIHGARINLDLLEASGSGYVGRHGPDFLLANDQWSQILNLRYGPDGQVYMIDWYDANECHRLDLNVHDRSNGRIFKVSYGSPTRHEVDLRQATDHQLALHQRDANDWYVRHARRLLQERSMQRSLDRAAIEALVAQATDDTDPAVRLRGMWALHVSGALGPEQIEAALNSEHPHVRGWAIQCALESSPDEIAPPLHARLVELARHDPSPVVRRFLASGLQRMPLPSRWDVLNGLVAHVEDRDDHNLPLLYWYAAEPLADVDPARLMSLVAGCDVPLLAEYAARRIASRDDREALAVVVDRLKKVEAPEVQRRVLRGMREALVGQRQVAMPDQWPEVSLPLLASADAEVRSLAQSLSVTFGDEAALAAMRNLLTDTNVEAARRESALATLVAAKDGELPETLYRLVQEDQALAAAALRALAQYDDARTPRVILERYAELPPAARRDALNTLASRPSFAAELLAAVEAGRLSPSDLSADVVRQLRNLNDPGLESRIREVWGSVRDTSEDKARLIAEYTRMLTRTPPQQPDLAHGRAIFTKTCAQCHRLFGIGGDVGPELTGSNRANLEYVLSNVLDPSALIAKDYMATIVATVDGRILTGIVRDEDDRTVTLQTANETITLPRDEIDEMQPSAQSMMPDDILNPLSEADVRALVAYLASPAQVPLLATADNAGSFFNERDLTGWRIDGGNWNVQRGRLVGHTADAAANVPARLTSDMLADDFRLHFTGPAPADGATVRVLFRGEPNGAGNWKRAYALAIDGRGGVELVERADAKSRTIVARDVEWKSGADRRFTLTADGSRLRLSIDDQVCFECDDPAGPARGQFAIELDGPPNRTWQARDLRLEVEATDGVATDSARR